MPKFNRRDFLKTVGQGTLAAGIGLGLPKGAWVYADEAEGAQNNNQTRENRLEADVLVVGGGFAALFAAIKACEQGARVVMVDKGLAGRSGLSPLAGSHLYVEPDAKLDELLAENSKTTEYVNNRDWSEILFKDSYARYQDLISYGVEFNESQMFGGELFKMASPVGAARSEVFNVNKSETGTLRNHLLKSGARILDRVMVTELLKQNGRIVGAIGMSVDSEDLYTFLAKATVMCVGPSGFKPAGYPVLVQNTCDGEAMAYRAGAEILGKEYSDTHTTLKKYAAVCGRVRLPDNLEAQFGRDEAFLKRGFLDTLVNTEGTTVNIRPPGTTGYKFSYPLLDFEAHAGRAPVYWVADGQKMEITGGACLGMSHRNADGLWPADTNGGSSLPGLYAAGDGLGTMVNGAVYSMIGSSSMGAMVTGARAGLAAAKEALKISKLTVDEKEIERGKRFVNAPSEQTGGYSPRWVTQLLQNTMMPYFVLYVKRADRLQAALTQVEFMQEHLVPRLLARDPHELRLAHETRNMVLSAEMRLRSSLFRTESRGNHYREDYPNRDDANWLAWTKIKEEQGKMKLIKVPVPKEWRPDLTIPYEERYPLRFPNEKV